VATFINKLSQKKELFVLVMMLEMLHLSIWFDFGSIISRSFMLSHLGLFLIWQPVWRGDKKLSFENTFLFIVFTLTLTIWLNLWLLFAWLILLIGFISGRVTLNRNESTVYILALGFLILELLFACVPELAKIHIENDHVFRMALPIIPILILVLPYTKSKQPAHTVDIIHAITTSMLTSLVALGSLLNMFLSETSYFASLTQTTIAIGGFIICISWLLSSQSRFGGVNQLWSNYMLNIGTPFEEWLSELSKINELDLTPDEFLHESMQKLVNFSWISGVKWRLNSTAHDIGNETTNEIEMTYINFNVCIYTYSPAGAALKLHSNLLIRLLHNYYQNKQRELELTKQAHLKAIYETGARITHDIKNLLQSLQAITSIITHDTDGSNVLVSQQVLRKQLPNLTQRLQLALDKLQAPKILDTKEIYLKDWWNDLQKRNSHHKILFQNDIHGDSTIPVDLFDSVVDNLLENIQSKQINETNVTITITLASNENLTSITVCDSGSMIPDDISRDLLSNAITSDNGLGIGLYQANKHAEMFGYNLRLINNQPGRVCFELSTKQDNQG
jgi:Histidine kinase-, DNA gyrase B-, and HSP90-like ATPase